MTRWIACLLHCVHVSTPDCLLIHPYCVAYELTQHQHCVMCTAVELTVSTLCGDIKNYVSELIV